MTSSCNCRRATTPSWAKGGSGLSGGQRQRLAIARAILLDPAILLLDDPTAAIDAETEHEIVQAMNAAMAGRTTFIVAHRLSTLRNADLVIVLERGRIAQMGTHEDLLRRRGLLLRWPRNSRPGRGRHERQNAPAPARPCRR